VPHRVPLAQPHELPRHVNSPRQSSPQSAQFALVPRGTQAVPHILFGEEHTGGGSTHTLFVQTWPDPQHEVPHAVPLAHPHEVPRHVRSPRQSSPQSEQFALVPRGTQAVPHILLGEEHTGGGSPHMPFVQT